MGKPEIGKMAYDPRRFGNVPQWSSAAYPPASMPSTDDHFNSVFNRTNLVADRAREDPNRYFVPAYVDMLHKARRLHSAPSFVAPVHPPFVTAPPVFTPPFPPFQGYMTSPAPAPAPASAPEPAPALPQPFDIGQQLFQQFSHLQGLADDDDIDLDIHREMRHCYKDQVARQRKQQYLMQQEEIARYTKMKSIEEDLKLKHASARSQIELQAELNKRL